MRNPLIWLITDTHWNADFTREIPDITGVPVHRNFRPENYGELLVASCRKKMASQDILIHMGDVINDRPGELSDILSKIPSMTKILIRGNHDKKNDTWYLNKGFDLVCDQMVKENILLSHIPVPVPENIKYNIHGHFHDNDLEHCFRCEPYIREFYGPKHKLLAMEYTNYSPVLFDEWK